MPRLPVWFAAALLASCGPRSPQPTTGDLRLERVGDRSLLDRAAGRVYALTEDAVVAVEPRGGAMRWRATVAATSLGQAGRYLWATGGAPGASALTLLTPDGAVVARCAVPLALPGAADQVALTGFSTDGQVYLAYHTWMRSPEGGPMPPPDEEARLRERSLASWSCGVLRVKVADRCRVHPTDPAPLGFARCADRKLDPLASLRERPQAAPVLVRERDEIVPDGHGQRFRTVTLVAGDGSWSVPLLRALEPVPMP